MRSLRAASIHKQLVVLAILLVVLVSIVAAVSEPFIYGRHDKGIEIGLFSGRLEMILDEFARSQTAEEEETALRFAGQLGMSVQRIPPSQASIIYERGAPDELVRRVRELTEYGFVESALRAFQGDGEPGRLVIKIDDKRALSFRMPVFPSGVWFAPAVASGLLKIVIPLVLLAHFGSWLITEPLVRFAAAAKRASMDDNSDEPFKVKGASEIRSLAASLNTMQTRIQHMLRDRTRMLRAISHDLRTPLTRLRMRVERSSEPELRRLMLADIETLGSMIDESLAFLDNTPEQSRNMDLSSLLQTISTDFSDTGVAVTFVGPRRLTYICKPQGMTRAISNLIDNARRYADNIEIELQQAKDGGVKIRVSDNGPGLPDSLKEKVLEPFFKADQARQGGARRGGFGLGLSIAQGIVKTGHQGTLRLLDREPNGLVVEIDLPPIKSAPTAIGINAVDAR